MIKLNLQFFGGRGAGGGASLGGGSGKPVNIKNETDVWSYRHNKSNEPFVDSMNNAIRGIQKDFPGIMDHVNTVNAVEMGGKDKNSTLGIYSPSTKRVGLNTNYTNVQKMNDTYDAAVKSGYHPSRGIKNGVQAVTAHEMGHAVTGMVAEKLGISDFDKASKKIVDNAYKTAKGKGGTKAWAGKISKYAQENNAECIAEAVADVFCNGNKAANESKAIYAELKRIGG